LEASVDVDDETVAKQHRVVARWLKNFLGVAKEYMIDSSKTKPLVEEEGENPYMETSSNIDED
jgi:hypothetical protein